jgi:uncharacterized membrane protein YagU involved in acid resistance
MLAAMSSTGRIHFLFEAISTIVPAGLICAATDISYVIVLVWSKGGNPLRMLQGIAYSVIGKATYEGGVATMALGLALHIGVALMAATIYFVLYRSLPALRWHWLASGIVFGALFYVFMQLVVLPLTLMPRTTFPPPNWVPIFIAHLTAVGPVIAFITHRLMGKLAADKLA